MTSFFFRCIPCHLPRIVLRWDIIMRPWWISDAAHRTRWHMRSLLAKLSTHQRHIGLTNLSSYRGLVSGRYKRRMQMSDKFYYNIRQAGSHTNKHYSSLNKLSIKSNLQGIVMYYSRDIPRSGWAGRGAG